MKIVYIAPIGLFDDWAKVTQIMKMCEAFSVAGAEVELIVPDRNKNYNNINTKTANPYEHNNVSNIFKITSLPILDFAYGSPSPIFYWLRWLSFIVAVKKYLRTKKYDVLYTREQYHGLFFKDAYLEQHKSIRKITVFTKFVLKRFLGFIVLTSFAKSEITELGISSERILVSHDGVRLSDFSNQASKEESRKKFGINTGDVIFGYVGTLKTFNMEKGVSDAILSLNFLPENYKLYVVGGYPADIEFYKNFSLQNNLDKRVIFQGWVPQKSISEYISCCDVLVAPFPKNNHYEYYMSPLKIFEYMASKKPMVVTNLNSLREVLKDNETALFIEPNDPKGLATAIEKLVSDKVLSERIVHNAYKEVENKYTWNKRAENILNFINL